MIVGSPRSKDRKITTYILYTLLGSILASLPPFRLGELICWHFSFQSRTESLYGSAAAVKPLVLGSKVGGLQFLTVWVSRGTCWVVRFSCWAKCAFVSCWQQVQALPIHWFGFKRGLAYTSIAPHRSNGIRWHPSAAGRCWFQVVWSVASALAFGLLVVRTVPVQMSFCGTPDFLYKLLVSWNGFMGGSQLSE
jgi:hypothetical protein